MDLRVTIRDLLSIARRRWAVLLALPVLGLLAALVITLVTPETYSSSASVMISWRGAVTAADLQQASQVTVSRGPTYASLAVSDEVLQETAQLTGQDVEALRSGVTASARDGQAYLDITAQAPTASAARDAAQTVASVLARRVPEIDTAGSGSPLVLTITSPARLPDIALTPRPRNNLLLGAVGGFALALAAAVALHAWDPRVRSRRDLHDLGVTDGVVTLPSPRSTRGGSGARTPALEQLRDRLLAAGRPSVVMVTEVRRGGVSTGLVQELATAVQSAGLLAAVVGPGATDGREPSAWHVVPSSGSTRSPEAQEPVRHLAASPRGATTAAGPRTTRTDVLDAVGLADLVLVDAPPLLEGSEGRLAATWVDLVVLVVRAGATDRTEVEAARSLLAALNDRPVLFVLESAGKSGRA